MSDCTCQSHKGYEFLKPDMTVDVYIQQDNGEHKFEGKARLIERLNTWYSPEPFPIVEHCKICKETTNNVKEKWVVELITQDPFRQSIRCIRYIHKFHSYGTPHVRDAMDIEERDTYYENDNQNVC